MWILGLKGLSPNIHIQILQTDFRTFSSIIVTFRFKDENNYEYEILFSFFAYYQKIDSPEFFVVLFFTRKVCTVIVIEGG